MAVLILGHRGSGRTDKNPYAAEKPPQHSIQSYQKCLEDGAAGFEL